MNFADQQQPILAQTHAANRQSTIKMEQRIQNEVEGKEESLLVKNIEGIQEKSGVRQNNVNHEEKRQNPNRNLTSETLQLYLKQVRNLNSETFQHLKEITMKENHAISTLEFIEILNKELPLNRRYIRLEEMKGLMEDGKKKKRIMFGRILNRSLKQFLKHGIKRLQINGGERRKELLKMKIEKGQEILLELQLDI